MHGSIVFSVQEFFCATITVFVRIVAIATINFSLAGVWLIIDGAFYLFWSNNSRYS